MYTRIDFYSKLRIKLNDNNLIKHFYKMNKTTSRTNWDETREYFKDKTIAFKELKKRKQIEIMKKELENKKYNEK